MLAEIARLEGIMLLLVLCGALLQKKQVIMPRWACCAMDAARNGRKRCFDMG